MKLTAQLSRQIECMNAIDARTKEASNVQAARLAGAVSRMMTTFQQGALTMQRLRTGGRQIVTVQHVNVGAGGQAVIAGSVTPGGRGGKDQDGGGIQNGR